ncbi:hypothetical protein BGW36DRAFT_313388, partial [Talaromyces proteolyticus]
QKDGPLGHTRQSLPHQPLWKEINQLSTSATRSPAATRYLLSTSVNPGHTNTHFEKIKARLYQYR